MLYILHRIWSLLVSLNHKVQLLLDGQARLIETLIPGPAVRLVFTAHLDDGTTQYEVTKMDPFRDDQKVLLTIQPMDAKKKPALLDGVPVWASSDETVVTVVADADGLSAVISGVTPGTARVVVTADADLGSGVTPLTGAVDVTITAGAAVSLEITSAPPASQ